MLFLDFVTKKGNIRTFILIPCIMIITHELLIGDASKNQVAMNPFRC